MKTEQTPNGEWRVAKRSIENVPHAGASPSPQRNDSQTHSALPAPHSAIEDLVEEFSARLERGEPDDAQEQHYPVRLPTDPGVAHVPQNLTHGVVVDTNDKVNGI